MKKNFLSLMFVTTSFVTFSQTALKMGPAVNGPSGSGPSTSAQAVTLIDAGTGLAYTPAVTATYTLTNQVFGAGTLEGLASNSAMSFGGTTFGTNSPITATALYPLMNSIGAATNIMFTACNSCGVGTGITVTTDRSISVFNNTDGFITSNSVNTQALNARVYVGDLTITFNRPVSNPILQFVGMGGTSIFSSGGINYDMGFATEFDLVGTAVTLNKLSGNAALVVSATQITNGSTWLGSSSLGTASNGITRFGASGSIAAVGTNIASITLKMYVRGDGGRINNGTTVVAGGTANGNPINPLWSLGATNSWNFVSPFVGNVSGDLMLFGVSFQKPVNIGGTVFNDPNAGNVNNSSTAAPVNLIPTGINANLLDASGRVVATVPVNTNGTYTFPEIFEGNYSVSISPTAGTQGALAPTAGATTGWGIAGEFNGSPNTGNDGTANGITAVFTAGTTNVTNINFGINRLPESANNLQATGGNPGGFNTQSVPAGAFQTNNVGATPNTSDYDGGTITSMRITAFPANANSITINGIIYTNGGTCPPAASCTAWPGAGVTVPYTNGTGPTQTITVDPIEGNVDVIIPFVAIDNGGREDATPGSVTIPFRTVTLAGTVFNDADGSLAINGAETVINGTNTGVGILTGTVLYANLIDASGNVIATVPVLSDGTYSFPNVPQSSTGLTVQLSQNQGIVGIAKPLTTLPTGWVTTGENKNGQAGAADATPNGEIPITTTTTNIITQNFGIQQLPESAVNSQTVGVNPGTTVNSPVNSSWFATSNVGVNPNTSDYNSGTVNNIRITAFPSNATSIAVGTTTYYPNAGAIPGTCPTTTCLVWPGAGVVVPASGGLPSQSITVDPIDGLVTVQIPFVAIDNAGSEDATPGSVSLTYSSILPIQMVSFSAIPKNNEVEIQWVVNEQINVLQYVVETSSNGRSFNRFVTLSANNNYLETYNTVHSLPILGINYYRIKIIDNNGTFKYSEIKKVTFGKFYSKLTIFPNPVKSNFNITINNSLINKSATISILSIEGKVLFNQKITNLSQTESLDVSNIPSGNYILRLSTDSEIINSKLQIMK